MRVLMLPHPDKISSNRTDGISQVVYAYARHLPDFDIELVSPDAGNYDLIASHAGLTGPVCDVAHLHGIHWTADYDAPDWEYRVNQRIVEAVRHASQITVPSEWVGETIQRDLHVKPTVVQHGIDWADWQHDEPHGDFVLWNKNRADPWVCNPMPLVRLANKFNKTHFVTTFVPDKTEPANNVNVIGIIPHVQMKRLVQSALVYLSTTKETFGIGILEALASGVPVLGYGHGGILEMVEHGVNGFLVEPGDTDGLAEGLAYCIQHRKTLGENGREMARGWTWERVCAQVAEVYQTAAVKQLPTVGVVIPVYNKTEEEIERSIRSALSQTYDKLTSVVVVDDGSGNPDVVSQVCNRLSDTDGRLHYRRQDNAGVAIARNRGIDDSHTKYICCLDADDWLAPDFLRVCVEALEKDRSLGIAYTGLRWHKADGSTGISQWPGDWDYDKQVERQNQVPTCNVFRRVMWERLGGYKQRYAPQGCGAEDAELWLRAGAYGFKAEKITTDALFNYSWLSGQASGNPDYEEVDWLAWHPWTKDRGYPFASYATAKRMSHPVRAYDTPAVSIVIPVGPGHEREVINALDSLEAQTFRQWEVIVVWDQDSLPPESLTAAYPYVKFQQIWGMNVGAGAARNRGVELARAPFLLFLDADDWLYPKALEKMVNAWNANRAIVYTDYVGKAIVDDTDKLAPDLQNRLYHYDDDKQEAVIGYKAFAFDCEKVLLQPELPRPYIWCNVTALIPKTWHEAIGGFDEEMLSWEDVEYHWRMARAGYCYHHLEEELMVYRFYTGSRRDKGLQEHKNLVKYIQYKYERDGDDIVGCRGCPGGSRSRRAAPAPAASMPAVQAEKKKLAETPGDDTDFVLVRLVDGMKGTHPITGTAAINPMTGQRFSYGHRADGDVFPVHFTDVYMVGRDGTRVLRAPGMFQPVEELVVNPPEAEPVETPPPTPLVEPEPVFDPQTLPGVTPKIAAEILTRFDSLKAVEQASVEEIMEVPGIGKKRAETIVEYLNR